MGKRGPKPGSEAAKRAGERMRIQNQDPDFRQRNADAVSDPWLRSLTAEEMLDYETLTSAMPAHEARASIERARNKGDYARVDGLGRLFADAKDYRPRLSQSTRVEPVDQAPFHQRLKKRVERWWWPHVVGVILERQEFDAIDRWSVKYALSQAGIPTGLPKHIQEIQRIALRFLIADPEKDVDLGSGERSGYRHQGLLLLWGQMARLSGGARRFKLPAKCGRFGAVAALNLALLCSPQFVGALGILMGDNLAYAESEQRANAEPEIDRTPQSGTCGCIPSGNPTHDDVPQLVFVAGVAFLIGFKIGTRMSRR